MQAGACGYLLKQYLVERLWLAMRTVLEGQIYLSPEVTTSFFRRFHFYSGCSVVPVGAVPLTEREREVLQWLVQGASNDAIARQMHITVATVKAHLTAIFEKLAVKSRTQAIVKALKLGLVMVDILGMWANHSPPSPNRADHKDLKRKGAMAKWP